MHLRFFCYWRRIRKPLIGSSVFLHFSIGLLCFVQQPSALLEIPYLTSFVQLYKRYDFPQTWRMFAPPSQTIDEIGYALKFQDGWTDLLFLNRFLKEQAAGRVFMPRGYIRVADHLRHPIFRQKRLEDEPFYFHYFQQMSAFFCFGDDAIPGIEAIRFYSVSKGVPPFFKDDGNGRPLPEAANYDKVVPLYERECSDR